MIFNSITELIGNTPLLQIPESVHGIPNLNLYCKLEYMNAFGSIKDRIALNMLHDHIEECKEKNKTVIEVSSGNTAKALALLCSMNNLTFHTITNRIKVAEIKKQLLLFNATIEELPGDSECPDPSNPDNYTVIAKKRSEQHPSQYFYPDQYFNPKNPRAHEKTGKELCADLAKIDYLFPFLGTAGSSIGIGKILKKERNTKLIGIVAERGHVIPGGRTLDEMWEVGFFDKSFYDDIMAGTTTEAIEGLLILIRKVGLLCGPTSGLAYKKTIDYFKKSPPINEKTAVFIACDRIEPYISYIERYAPEILHVEKRHILSEITIEEVVDAPELTFAEFAKNAQDFLVIDIRSRRAFEMFHLPNSINIPEDEIETFFEASIPLSKYNKLLVVCSKGLKSKKITAFLIHSGYDAFAFKNGYTLETHKEYFNSISWK